MLMMGLSGALPQVSSKVRLSQLHLKEQSLARKKCVFYRLVPQLSFMAIVVSMGVAYWELTISQVFLLSSRVVTFTFSILRGRSLLHLWLMAELLLQEVQPEKPMS